MASSSCLLILGFAVCVGALGSTTLSQIETISLEPESSFASISLREEKRGSSDKNNENENTNPDKKTTTTSENKNTNQVTPESDPQGVTPESDPQEVTPESDPQGVTPEPNPQGVTPEPNPQGVAKPISQSLPTLHYFDFGLAQGIARAGLIMKLFKLAGQEYNFDPVPVGTKLQQKSGPWNNFANQVPILTHDNFKLAETIAIQIYIAEKYVAGNEELTPEERATNYMFFSFDGNLMGQVAKWSDITDAGKDEGKWKPSEKERATTIVERILEGIENRLIQPRYDEQPYVNKSISAADAAVCNVESHIFLKKLGLRPPQKMRNLCKSYNSIVTRCYQKNNSQCDAIKDCAINKKTERCAPKQQQL